MQELTVKLNPKFDKKLEKMIQETGSEEVVLEELNKRVNELLENFEIEPKQNNKKENLLLQEFGEFVGCVKESPTDMSTEHDHYAYGTPKKYEKRTK